MLALTGTALAQAAAGAAGAAGVAGAVGTQPGPPQWIKLCSPDPNTKKIYIKETSGKVTDAATGEEVAASFANLGSVRLYVRNVSVVSGFSRTVILNASRQRWIAVVLTWLRRESLVSAFAKATADHAEALA